MSVLRGGGVKMISVHAGMGAGAQFRRRARIRPGESRWTRHRVGLLACASIAAVCSVAGGIPMAIALHHFFFDRTHLPDLDSFTRFDFSTIGHVYDTDGRPLTELARGHRPI